MRRRRRRGSSHFEEGSTHVQVRHSRRSLPSISFDGRARDLSIGIADGAMADNGYTAAPERQRRMSGMAFTLPGVSGSLHTEPPSNDDEDVYLFPSWWFAMLCTPGMLHNLVMNALWGVIWPQMLSEMAGNGKNGQYKALALAAGGQIATVIGYTAPFVGSLSDRLPNKYAKYIGRRRPFIILGNAIAALGVWMTYDALYRIVERPADAPPLNRTIIDLHIFHHEITMSEKVFAYVELALSLVVGNTGGGLLYPPWGAIVPETIPLSQRGQCIMVQSWCNTVISIIGAGVCWVIGEGRQVSCFGRIPCLTAKEIWFADIWILLIQIAIYYRRIDNKGPSKDRSTRTNHALYHKEGLIGRRVTTEQPKGPCLQHIQIEVTD
eukprot:COSAG01_NODE_11608_length_1895_cov_1.610802_1_plen_379_part_01